MFNLLKSILVNFILMVLIVITGCGNGYQHAFSSDEQTIHYLYMIWKQKTEESNQAWDSGWEGIIRSLPAKEEARNRLNNSLVQFKKLETDFKSLYEKYGGQLSVEHREILKRIIDYSIDGVRLRQQALKIILSEEYNDTTHMSEKMKDISNYDVFARSDFADAEQQWNVLKDKSK